MNDNDKWTRVVARDWQEAIDVGARHRGKGMLQVEVPLSGWTFTFSGHVIRTQRPKSSSDPGGT